MHTKTFQISDPTEAAFAAQVILRRVLPGELARCQQEVCNNHYLKNAHLVGEQLWYVAQRQGQWLALPGWSAAAWHLKGRDAWIGWNDTQRRARLPFIANNTRFCLLTPPGQHPNLASHVMGQCLERLSQDWLEACGHPILAVESFVDTQLFRGTCYKATGWQAVGCTAGFRRVAEDFYQVHDRPKQLFARPLAGSRSRGRQEQRNPRRPDAARPPRTGRHHRPDGRAPHTSRDGPRDRAGRRGKLPPGGQGQPTHPPRPGQKPPAGGFFPLRP